MVTVRVKVERCVDCPFYEEKQSPYTGDSFDMCDVDSFCKKKDRMISCSDRPWQAKKLPIPK